MVAVATNAVTNLSSSPPIHAPVIEVRRHDLASRDFPQVITDALRNMESTSTTTRPHLW